MSDSAENERLGGNNNSKKPKYEFAKGVNSWLIIMVIILATILILDNYSRFGIRKWPSTVIYQVIWIIIEHWWFYGIIFMSLLQQTVQMFFIEKLLVHDLISERIGMTFHALNVFVLPTVCVVTVRIFNVDKVLARLVLMYLIFITIKSWSYAFVNSRYRNAHQTSSNKISEDDIDETPSIRYPDNVTLRNAIVYMLFTPPIQYQLHYPRRGSPDSKLFIVLVLKLFLVYCGFNFISSQFILPELQILKLRKDIGNIGKLLHILRVVLPFNLVWLLYYYQNFKCAIPAYAAVTGMKQLNFSSDWWNSGDLNVFWRKWNVPVHRWLKYNVVLPLIHNGFQLNTARLCAFLIAGIIHEYLNTLPFGIYNGFGLFITFTEIPQGCLTEYIARRYGNQYGNCVIWLYLLTSHTFSIVYMGTNFDDLV